MEKSWLAFCDGACSGNPGPGGYGWILSDLQTVKEGGGYQPHSTNNKMELKAAIDCIEGLGLEPGTLKIHSDSTYVIKGITQWIHSWIKKDFKDIKNPELWQQLYTLCAKARHRGLKLTWTHVDGHNGVPGNERADRIATAYAKGKDPGLYLGSYQDYGIDLSLTKRP